MFVWNTTILKRVLHACFQTPAVQEGDHPTRWCAASPGAEHEEGQHDTHGWHHCCCNSRFSTTKSLHFQGTNIQEKSHQSSRQDDQGSFRRSQNHTYQTGQGEVGMNCDVLDSVCCCFTHLGCHLLIYCSRRDGGVRGWGVHAISVLTLTLPLMVKVRVVWFEEFTF